MENGFLIVWLIVMPIVAVIVLLRWKSLREGSSASGMQIGIREASALQMLTCRTPMPMEVAAAKLADGVPAGDLVCTWDAERSAYCFRSELPDGSVPLYCTAAFTEGSDGTQLTLIRQKQRLRGSRDVIMRLGGYLKEKLGADAFSWTTDGTCV